MEAGMFPKGELELRQPSPHLNSDLCVHAEYSGAREVGGHLDCHGMLALSLASPQGQYRTVLYDSWVKQLTTHLVPHTLEPTLIGTLGNPVKIRSWQVPTRGARAVGLGLQFSPGWARSLPPPSHLLSWGCSEMPPLNPPRASQRVVGRGGES